jgi:hypothetical protein
VIETIIKALGEALFGSLLAYLKARQVDADLKALGYAEATRDAAVSQLQARDAVIAAQAKMAAVQSLDRAATIERLSRGDF